jgi:tetratricopeptide (TPR) repeat protein
MLVRAGDAVGALKVFTANKTAFDTRYGHQRRLEEAEILRGLGRTAEAFARLEVVTNDVAASPMARLQAGRQYGELADFAAGEAALASARNEIPVADYYLAQLKLRQGQVDECMELLERVSKVRPAEVRRMLREEADAWSAVAQDVRFQELSKLLPASPGR